MSKHTPGPWELVDASVPLDRDGFVATDTDKTIEIRPAAGVKLGDEREDLVLMSSSPELLASLRDLVSQIQGFQACNGDKGFVLTDATNAIAKATGAA